MKNLISFHLFENIQQGKSILSKNNIPQDDERWKQLLDIFKTHHGYIGSFAQLVFENNWSIDSVKYIFDNYIGNRNSIILFRKLSNPIESYTEEGMLDELGKIKKKKQIKDVYDMFPTEQRSIIDKIDNKESILYDLSLRTDLKVFIKKISRYKTLKDLKESLDRFLNSKVSVGHSKIREAVKKSGAEVIIDDEMDNLIIVHVNYYQLKELASHTSWCILSQGTFNSYNKICKQYIIFFTDKTGNESMIGATIGINITAAHFIDDKSVTASEVTKRLSSRGYDVSDLYMDISEYHTREFNGSNLKELLHKKYKKEDIFKLRKNFNYFDFKDISDDEIEKYKLKLIDSNTFNAREAIKFFEKGALTQIGFHIESLYEEFGDKIIKYIDPKFKFDTVSSILISLVEKVEGFKFKTFKQLIKRIQRIDGTSLKFILDRKIPFKNEDIINVVKEYKYGTDFVDMIKLIPSLFDGLKEYIIKSSSLEEMKKLLRINGLDKDVVKKICFDKEKSIRSRYISEVVPSTRYSGYGEGRREAREFLRLKKVESFGVQEFMSNEIWGDIKKFELFYGGWGIGDNDYYLFAFMSCAKLDMLDELKVISKLNESMVGKIIRMAMYRPDSKFGVFHNSKPLLPPPFILTDDEEEKLMNWLIQNYSSDKLILGYSNETSDKELKRHLAFSVIYYKYGWGFSNYTRLVRSTTPYKEDKWTDGNVRHSITRPELFKHIINYLICTKDMDSLEDILDTILDMKLKDYELSSLLRKVESPGTYGIESEVKSALDVLRKALSKHGYKISVTNRRNSDWGVSTHNMVVKA